MDEFVYASVMSTEVSFIVKTVLGILGGLLIATGFLPAESKDAFTSDASTAAGYIVTIISTVYLLEHALIKVKDDLQYSDEPTTEVTVNTPPETPAPPAA